MRKKDEVNLLLKQISDQNTELRLLNNNLNQLVEQKIHELEIERDIALQANSAKSEFLSNMSHELRTPMHAIRSFIQLAAKKVTDEKVINYLDKAKVSSDRLMNLLNLLLDLSRIESGKMPFDKQKHNLAAVITEAVDSIYTLSLAKGITIDITKIPDHETCLDKILSCRFS